MLKKLLRNPLIMGAACGCMVGVLCCVAQDVTPELTSDVERAFRRIKRRALRGAISAAKVGLTALHCSLEEQDAQKG